MKPAKVLIVDDHDIVRHGIRSIIANARPEWEICGEAANGQHALEAVRALEPDVVILDITMPVMNGLEAAVQIKRLGLPCRILVCTMHESERLYDEIRQAGAHGCVHKSRAAHDLIAAMDKVLSGQTFFRPDANSTSDN